MRLNCMPLCFLAIALAGCCGAAHPRPPSGFVALFNGRSLDGWRGLPGDLPAVAKMSNAQREAAQLAADERMVDHWHVTRKGWLAFDGAGDNICTIHDFADFELLIDWRIPPNGDSGVYLRSTPQVQIWDDPVGSGGLYNNRQHPSKPLARADNSIGKWNTFRIRIVGDHVTVHLNDVLVVADTPMENFWQPGEALPAAGSIELQAHGGPLEFRNIFLREVVDGQ